MGLQIIFQLVAKHVSATDPALLSVESDLRTLLPQPRMLSRTDPAGSAFASSLEAKPSVTERTTGGLEPVIHKEP
jgi:hypothetical protein